MHRGWELVSSSAAAAACCCRLSHKNTPPTIPNKKNSNQTHTITTHSTTTPTTITNMDLYVNSSAPPAPPPSLSPPLPGASSSSPPTSSSSSSSSGRMPLFPPPPQSPHQYQQQQSPPMSFLSSENVASVPPPGLSAPSQVLFLPHSSILTFIAVVPKQQHRQHSSSVASSLGNNNSTHKAAAAAHPRAVANSHTHTNGNTFSERDPKPGMTNDDNNNNKNTNGTSSGIVRSSYRPLTTSNVAATTATMSTGTLLDSSASSNNNTTPLVHPSSTAPTPPSSSPTPNASSSATTERVLLCLDLEAAGQSYSKSRSSTAAGKANGDNGDGNNNNNNDNNEDDRDGTKQARHQAVPLLQWDTINSNQCSKMDSSSGVGSSSNNNNNNTNFSNNNDRSSGSSIGLNTNSNNRLTGMYSTSKRRALSSTAFIGTRGNSTRGLTSSVASTSASTTIATTTATAASLPASSLEERLRRQKAASGTKISPVSSGSLTQFSCVIRKAAPHTVEGRNIDVVTTENERQGSLSNSSIACMEQKNKNLDSNEALRRNVRLLIPSRGNLYVQNGISLNPEANKVSVDSTETPTTTTNNAGVSWTCIHDKSITGVAAMDAQLSPDGTMVAWTFEGELYVQASEEKLPTSPSSSPFSPNESCSVMGDSSTTMAMEDCGYNSGGEEPVNATTGTGTPAVQISFGASQTETCSISHGVADFVAQEEMDRYRGFWWHPDSNAILFTRNDESDVPLYRIMHHSNSLSSPTSSTSASLDQSSSQHYERGNNGSSRGFTPSPRHNSSSIFEDHRYPFAGKANPVVKLALVQVDRESIVNQTILIPKPSFSPPSSTSERRDGVESLCDDDKDLVYVNSDDDPMQVMTAQEVAIENWASCLWLDAPREANEYLARVHWLPDGYAVTQWQNRAQTCTILYRIDLRQRRNHSGMRIVNGTPTTNDRPGSGRGRTLLVERSDIWINLHHMFYVLPRAIHPDECVNHDDLGLNLHQQQPTNQCPPTPNPLPDGSFSFLFASERTGFTHLYLYTYCPGINGELAVLLKTVTSGSWIVESILGVDMGKDIVYFSGTLDSVLERHLYAMPLLGVKNNHQWRYGATASVAHVDDFQHASPASEPTFTHTKRADEIDEFSTTKGEADFGLHARNGQIPSQYSSVTNNSTADKPSELYFVKSNKDLDRPTRITHERGMHNLVLDYKCRYFVDTSSDLDRPTTVKVYELPTDDRMSIRTVTTLYDASKDDVLFVSEDNHDNESVDLIKCLPAPELFSFPTSDGTERLYAALYRPDPCVYGHGPYPLISAVYGGPHVQRVNRSWSQSADMRAQRLRSLGFCLVKCDNRGSSRRGLAFECAISRRLGRLEVLDQVAAVRQLVVRGIVDPLRVGIYGWSYGGYLSAMCLCRAPDVFHVAVAGAPVTSWDGYDTHYTERYMGLPADNPAGYRESAVFDHVPNMRGRLMIVHGLIDENVHFRHTTRLINKLIAAGKDYDLLIFPEERHSPRRLRDRIYMEQRISEYFMRHLGVPQIANPTALDLVTASMGHGGLPGLRAMAGHL